MGDRPLDLRLFGDEHVRRYEETGGEVGGVWNGVPILILTTRGRRTGQPRKSALIYGRDGDDPVIIASQGGAPTHPNWYHNLSADPEVEVQIGAARFPATARTAAGDERDRLWSLMTSIWPRYDTYQSRTERTIPVVVLQRA